MSTIKIFIDILIIDIVYCRFFRIFYSLGLLLTSFAFRLFNRKSSDKFLLMSHSYCDMSSMQIFLEHFIRDILNDDSRIRSLLPDNCISLNDLENWTIILKPKMNKHEKGVIVIKYSSTFAHFYNYYNTDMLLEDYYIILEPNWAGCCIPQILIYSKPNLGEVIVEATDYLDYNFIGRLNSNLKPLPLGPGDWINPNSFYPIPGTEKIFDCCMICGWADYKRHHILLRALSKIKKRKLKAVLVGNSFGGMKSDKIERMVDFYNLRQQVTIIQDLSPADVNLIYNQSKVNILLSYKEGGNKTLFEGMFANTPSILIDGNIGVNKTRINYNTGVIAKEKDLPQVLLDFSENYDRFTPRQWAMENISCVKTTETLNKFIKEIAKNKGEQWSMDLIVKYNAPWRMSYYNKEDRVSHDILNIYRKQN